MDDKSESGTAKPEKVLATNTTKRVHPRVALHKTGNGSITICADTNDEIAHFSDSLVKAFGAIDEESARYLHGGLMGAIAQDWNNVTETEVNEPTALAASIGAKDPIEGMLAAQMAATHIHAMKMLGKINCATSAENVSTCSSAANKLLRTFAAQVEALKKHRAKASQTVRVERVYVTEGGQAIVGDVFRSGGGNQKK